APGEAGRVHRRRPLPQERRDPTLELREVAPRVLVDRTDGRAREDVVELLQQQELPEPLQLRARVLATRDGEELGIVETLLRQAVAALDEGLRGVGAAVVLEVELADDDR